MKQPLFIFLTLLIGAGGFFFLGVRALYAQEEFSSLQVTEVSPVASPVPSSDPNSVDPLMLQELTELYYREVESYREAEEKYTISREQYYQLNTLAAQEDAVFRAKEVLRARAQVLKTYFSYLRLLLLKTRGIELGQKQSMLALLEAETSNLQFYQERVGGVTRRTEVAEEFAILNAQEEALRSLAFSTQALIKLGQLQIALDQSKATRDLVAQWLEQSSLSAASRAKKQRGLEEVDRLLQRADNNLDEVFLTQAQRQKESQYSESRYRQFQTQAEYSYLQLRQALSFMEEIVQEP